MKKTLPAGISCHKGVQYGLFIGQKAWFLAGASSRKKSNYGKVMQLLFVQPFLSVRLNFHKSKLFITNIKGNFYERVQELDAREKTLIKIRVGLFYLQMHFIMCILCKQDCWKVCETGSTNECKTSCSARQTVVNANTLFLAFPVRFRVVALDLNFKPVQEKVSDQ